MALIDVCSLDEVPLVNLFPVTTILLAVIVLGERLTRPQTIGIVLAITSAALLS